MAKYLLNWKVDTTRTPEDVNERQQQWLTFLDTVTQQLESGQVKDWGLFVGELKGYSVIEGTEVDVQTFANQWTPFAEFDVTCVVSVVQDIEAVKA